MICTGDNQQYSSASDCATKCGAFTKGTGSYSTAATSGNTDFCRSYHLTAAAASAGAATTHCPHTAATSATCQ